MRPNGALASRPVRDLTRLSSLGERVAALDPRAVLLPILGLQWLTLVAFAAMSMLSRSKMAWNSAVYPMIISQYLRQLCQDRVSGCRVNTTNPNDLRDNPFQ